jgi:hypothetical protein
MIKSMKKKNRVIIAVATALLAVVLAITVITALAAPTETLTVTINSSNTIRGSGGQDISVTLTNTLDPFDTETVYIVNSSVPAVFLDFYDPTLTYTLKIVNMVGFVDFTTTAGFITGETEFEFTAAEDFTSISTISVSGKVTDENGDDYTGGGKVHFSGYDIGDVDISTVDGTFSIDPIYADKNYKFWFVPNDDEYENPVNYNSGNDISFLTNKNDMNFELKIKTFDITITSPSNGAVTVAPIETDIEFGTTGISVSAVADDDYGIASFVVKNDDTNVSETIPDAVSRREYTYPFDPITANYTVTVTFALLHEVTVLYNNNGTVAVAGGIEASPGVFEIIDGGNLEFTFNPSFAAGYDLESVYVSTELISNSALLYNGTGYTYTLSDIDDDEDVVITFSPIQVEDDSTTVRNESTFFNYSYTNNLIAGYPGTSRIYNFINSGASFTFEPNAQYPIVRLDSPGGTASSPSVISSLTVDHVFVYEATMVSGARWVRVNLINPIEIIIDKIPPVVEIIPPSMDWTKDNYTINGTVTDPSAHTAPSSGLSHVVWSTGTLTEAQVLTAGPANIMQIIGNSFSLLLTEEQEQTYYFYAVDRATNVSDEKTIDIKIDKTDPEITGFTFQKLDPADDGEIVFSSYATIFGADIEVVVTAQDLGVSSGLNEITLRKTNAVGVTTFETKPVVGDSAAFRLEYDGFSRYEISAFVTDNVGRMSGTVKPTDVNTNANSNIVYLSNIRPVISIEPVIPSAGYFVTANGQQWFRGDIEFKVTVRCENEDIGIKSVNISINGDPLEFDIEGKRLGVEYLQRSTYEEVFIINTSQGNRALDGSYQIRVTAVNDIYISYIKDTVGPDIVYKDDAAPRITGFTFIPDDILFTDYATIYGGDIEVVITASDPSPSSGLKEITLFRDGVPYGDPKPVVGGSAAFTLLYDDFKNNFITASVTDNVDNVSARVGPANTDTETNARRTNRVILSNEQPTVTIVPVIPSTGYFSDTATGRRWFNDDIVFEITVSGLSYGVRSVEISINDVKLDADINGKDITNVFEEEETYREVFIISTAQGILREDGSFTIDITAVNDIRNDTVKPPDTVYKDTAAPRITGFAFTPLDHQDVSGNTIAEQITDYGFYFNQTTVVRIFAADDAPSSGIRSITYYTVDVSGRRSADTTVNVSPDNSVAFTLPENFKGQIFARATDRVDNTTANNVTPHGIIVEMPAWHSHEEHIFLSLGATAFTDNTGLPLYTGDTNVSVRIADTFSGLRRVEWTVTAPNDTGNNSSGSFEIANNGSFVSGGNSAGWVQTIRDRNLVTELTGIIPVSNNSNNIRVWVRITDRAGNVSENTIDLSIDRTNPVIEVTFDNNAPDSVHSSHYSRERVATVVITERNFRASDVNIRITNQTYGVIPSVSSWVTSVNNANPDSSTHTATISFLTDGEYTLDISYSDNANNQAATVPQSRFTIDLTDPEILVTYDNMSFQNDNYFSADRVATIVITERNFDPSRVNIIGTVDGAASAAYPELSAWTSDDIVHTATLHYTNDAPYTFDITFRDMAGNAAAAYNPQEFIIDKTAPVLARTSPAQDGGTSIYRNPANEEPVKELEFYDTNFSHIIFAITAHRFNDQGVHNDITMYEMVENVGPQRETSDITVSLPPELFDENGIYEVRATAYDKAGNSSGEIIHTHVVMREVPMMAYIPGAVLASFNGIHMQAINFPDIPISIYAIAETDFDIYIGETLLVPGDYELSLTNMANGVIKHTKTILSSYIARTFNQDDQVYELPINVSMNPIRTVGRMIINNVKPSGIFGSDLVTGKGYYGVSQQEIQVIRLSDGINTDATIGPMTTVNVNGANVPYTYSSADRTITFILDESRAYGHRGAGHQIRVTLIDTAGNQFAMDEIHNVYVGSWIGRHWIFILAGGLAIVGIVTFTVVKVVKRRNVD